MPKYAISGLFRNEDNVIRHTLEVWEANNEAEAIGNFLAMCMIEKGFTGLDVYPLIIEIEEK